MTRRILLVEDHADCAAMLQAILRLKGIECKACRDSAEALRALESFEPFAVIIDVGLPGPSGLDLARAIRARPNGANIVLVGYSGYGRQEDFEHAAAASMDAYFVKPADPIELLASIEQIAAVRSQADRVDWCPQCGGQIVVVARDTDYRSEETSRCRCTECGQIVERPVGPQPLPA